MWGVTGEWEALDGALRRSAAAHCGICWQSCKRGTGALECAGCGQSVHVRCAFPMLGITRTALFKEWSCDSCVDMELDGGVGAEIAPGAKGRAAELARAAQELEGMALAKGSHATYATGVQALDDFVQRELDIDSAEMWAGLDRLRVAA